MSVEMKTRGAISTDYKPLPVDEYEEIERLFDRADEAPCTRCSSLKEDILKPLTYHKLYGIVSLLNEEKLVNGSRTCEYYIGVALVVAGAVSLIFCATSDNDNSAANWFYASMTFLGTGIAENIATQCSKQKLCCKDNRNEFATTLQKIKQIVAYAATKPTESHTLKQWHALYKNSAATLV